MSMWNVDTPEGLDAACAWMIGHLSHLADHAVWTVPRSGAIIHIDKPNKTATIAMALMPEPSTKKVLRKLGWKVIDKAFPETKEDE